MDKYEGLSPYTALQWLCGCTALLPLLQTFTEAKLQGFEMYAHIKKNITMKQVPFAININSLSSSAVVLKLTHLPDYSQ